MPVLEIARYQVHRLQRITPVFDGAFEGRALYADAHAGAAYGFRR